LIPHTASPASKMWTASDNEKMKRGDRYSAYITLVLFLVFFLTFFNFTISLGRWLFYFSDIYRGNPFTGVLINFNFLLLAALLLVLYRRWKAEMVKGKSRKEALLALQKAVETMQTGVTITDPEGKILYINPAEAAMHGYSVEEIMGKDARILGPPEIWRPMSQPILKSFRRETTNARKDGSTFPVQLTSDVVMTPEGNIFAVITTSEDITDRMKNEETIRKLAFYDALTGLPNRALFNDRLSQSLVKARRHGEVLPVMFLDLDRFKNVNDTLGHGTGDLLLIAAADRLKKIVRESDTVSRLGGDEFVMMFPDMDTPGDVSMVARKILERMSEAFILNGVEVYVTASIGISMFPQNGSDGEDLLRNADAAMYFAKDQGRNNYQFYNSAINDSSIRKIRMESDLRKAVNEKEFVVYYQPQLDLRKGNIAGAEALVRWHHPEYGLLSPLEFIPLAEETGVIASMGEFLLLTACAQNKAWQEAGFPHIRVAVNISTYQFIQKGFMEMLKKMLEELELEPKYLELEFTESIVMKNTNLISSTFNELRSLGINCSIDDFGTGYSALNYLKYLPISGLKLDQSFVASLSKDPSDEAISRAIITMAHELNLKVTAEGVETVQQLEFLCSHRCDEAQGFLFSEPLPAPDFARLLAEKGSGGGSPSTGDFSGRFPAAITSWLP
jgi:diguanylate cyclase (GGDEF)-like protein/PAS domain S-box-containing protein